MNSKKPREEYDPPLIGHRPPSLRDVWRYVADLSFRVWHSLLPHEPAGEPARELPALKDGGRDMYDVCYGVYRDSIDRIDKLERKAINLLPYITGLLALFSFLIVGLSKPAVVNVGIIIVASLLILAILISFRCTSVKAVKSRYALDMYDFDDTEAGPDFDLSRLSTDLLNCAVFNTNVGNNVADMLNAARELLRIALVLGALVAIPFFGASAWSARTSDMTEKAKPFASVSQEKGPLAGTGKLVINRNDANARLDSLERIVSRLVEELPDSTQRRVSSRDR